jgi:hypothetical protein
MFRSRRKQQTDWRASEYASCKDFQRIFTEDMVGLHHLAFLLTADQTKAEQCFVAGLEDSIHGNPVFRQWARAWSKRAIIQNAIKTISPVPTKREPEQEKAATSSQHETSPENIPDIVAIVAAWEPFERFVFVMAVLEGYSPRECSTLLACPVQDVVEAKSLALERLAGHPWQKAAAEQCNDTRWSTGFAHAQVA